MISGFFRSPDVMGWHAATLAMLAVTLALRSTGAQRLFWTGLAGWGGVGLMLCGRRKMITMIPIFVAAFLLFHMLSGRTRRAWPIVLAVAVACGLGFMAYRQVGSDRNVEVFYASTVDEFAERVHEQGLGALLQTIRQAGFFGQGLGMATQGVHHIQADRPRVWQESGPSMLMVEFGIPGFIAFFLVAAALARRGWRALRVVAMTPAHTVFFGLAAMVIANTAAGVVSAQIFGDPFIGCFLPFVIGLVLSGTRLRRRPAAAAAGAPQPAALQT